MRKSLVHHMRNPWTTYWQRIRARRESWRPVLEMEIQKWSAKSYEELVSDLKGEPCYERRIGGETFQIEVTILENNTSYIHVGVSVDDGSLPASLRPMASSFIRERSGVVPSK